MASAFAKTTLSDADRDALLEYLKTL